MCVYIHNLIYKSDSSVAGLFVSTSFRKTNLPSRTAQVGWLVGNSMAVCLCHRARHCPSRSRGLAQCKLWAGTFISGRQRDKRTT